MLPKLGSNNLQGGSRQVQALFSGISESSVVEVGLIQIFRLPGKLPSLIGIGILLLLGTAACAFQETELRETSYQVSESPRLVIRNGNGNVTVKSGGDQKTIQVTATIINPDRVDYRAEKVGNTVEVTVKVKKGFGLFGAGGGVNIEVVVPENIDLDLKSDNGRMTAENITGPVSAETSNGRITLDRVTGIARGKTSNGKIEVRHFSGQIEAQTSNGAIEFDGSLRPGSNNRLRTSNGSVNVTLVDTLGVELDATTNHGSAEQLVQSMLPTPEAI